MAILKRIISKYSLFTYTSFKFIFNEKYRNIATNEYLEDKINNSKRINQYEKENLLLKLNNRKKDSYINHFVYQNSTTFLIEPLKYIVLGSLTILGQINETDTFLMWLFASPAERTLYTTGVMIYNSLKKKSKPCLALGIGAIPFIGSLAYIIQDINTNSDEIGIFMLKEKRKDYLENINKFFESPSYPPDLRGIK